QISSEQDDAAGGWVVGHRVPIACEGAHCGMHLRPNVGVQVVSPGLIRRAEWTLPSKDHEPISRRIVGDGSSDPGRRMRIRILDRPFLRGVTLNRTFR